MERSALGVSAVHSMLAVVVTTLPSGRTIEEAVDLLMGVYGKWAGKNYAAENLRPAPPLIYTEAATFMSQ